MKTERIHFLREKCLQNNIDAFLVSKPENRYYVSGLQSSAGALLITKDSEYIIVDFRYFEQAKKVAPDWEVVQQKTTLNKTLAGLIRELGISSLGVESHYLSHFAFQELQSCLNSVNIVPVTHWVEEKRQIKDNAEIELIAEAARITDNAFVEICKHIKAGISEKALASQLEFMLRSGGAEKLSFETIAASGVRSSLPHGIASDKIIDPGDLLTLDFGGVYAGYHADLTRTVVVGEVNPKQSEIYHIVLNAQQEALKQIGPGKKSKDIDSIARDYITKAGYGEYFGHSLGHSVGLEIHEDPNLSQSSDVILQPGMVVTVEPGIYIPGFGGVRIEDLVLITETGCRILSNCPKNLITI